MNGHANGVNGSRAASSESKRFKDVPHAIDVTVSMGDEQESVEIDLIELTEDPTELLTMLENENAPRQTWLTIAMAHAKKDKINTSIEVMNKALQAFQRGAPQEKLGILNTLCWLYLRKCREAPRTQLEGQLGEEVKDKNYYIKEATQTLNEASRISPSYPPLFLARGVLYLLRASILSSPKPRAGGQDHSERADTLRQALKCFDDALRASNGKNMMAYMGKARVFFSMSKYGDALQQYQTVLERAPDIYDPDPRIGIGCCLWQLGHKEEAKAAWERALRMTPDSKIANILLGLYYLHCSSQYPTTDPRFSQLYKQAISDYVQKAWKSDPQCPLSCVTFGQYLLIRKASGQVEKLARSAIELSDVNAVISDGWYLRARNAHNNDNITQANDFYTRSDQARGGDDRGYLPAKFGMAQMRVLMNDYEGAKFRLEKLVQHTKSIEAMTLLGSLYAEDVFQAQAQNSKEEKSTEIKKATGLLEQVRNSWKDSKKKVLPDSSVLLNLARLYEVDHPEKSFQCLQQVEQMELDEIPDEDRPTGIEDKAVLQAELRQHLPPQLLNNMGCFLYQSEKLNQARDLFEAAMQACVKISQTDPDVDTDALVTTISFNLARTCEAEGSLVDAKRVYEGLLKRHADYSDANTRMTYIKLRENPKDEGPKAVSSLQQADPSNLEVRALYGWFISRAKKRTHNFAEDQEQRHYKHTLQHYDKHDRYSLTGMGNICLTIAREMRRDTDQEKEKRRKMYERAVEFFDKALQLDPKNAYAAQGIGIAMTEDKRDFQTAVQTFQKVRETMKDASVFINLGHVYCELKQYSRAIENYEAALAKDRARDPQILACLGRVWLLRGKQEKSVSAMKQSLDFSRRALEVNPDQIHFKFNVAFVQIQLAQLIYSLSEAQRTLEDVESAAGGLDQAIESFTAIAKSPNPPFPRNDIEQRANMGRNTMRRQLARAVQNQKEYEQKNAARLQQAREQREAEIRRREEEKRKAEEAAEERRRKIAGERQALQEHDRELAGRLAEEERRREEAEMTDDPETGERVKRTKQKGGKRKKKGAESEIETDPEGSEGEGARRSRQRSAATSVEPGTGDEGNRRKKKRKLERKSKQSSKFKSSELIVDSDEELGDEDVDAQEENIALAEKMNKAEDEAMLEDDEEVVRPRKKANRIIDDDEDEDEEEAMGTAAANGDEDGGEGNVSMQDAVGAAPASDNDE